ncbi:MAG: TIGR04053 family radical SAM/SPASM domain-containing protein [Conexivisphaerales archaeon]
MPFESKPLLVFWEMTRACNLFCLHCRASAIKRALPGELSTADAKIMLEDIQKFGRPYPTVILTGGDPLLRKDFFEIIQHLNHIDIPFAVSPAVTEMLNEDILLSLKKHNTSSISVSLDGSSKYVHDRIRSVDGTFDRTMDVIRKAVALGINIQVNTTIMKQNVFELPYIFELVRRMGVRTWELFFLIGVGRATGVEETSPAENESICNFLYDASRYGMILRCVEAPFIRRVVASREGEGSHEYRDEQLYKSLRSSLLQISGRGERSTSFGKRGTLDGDGTIFVAYNGIVQPGGLLQYGIGNVRQKSLVDIYREDQMLVKIRKREFEGKCGECVFKEICGGSRARAFTHFNNLLASDPGCISTTCYNQQVSNSAS